MIASTSAGKSASVVRGRMSSTSAKASPVGQRSAHDTASSSEGDVDDVKAAHELLGLGERTVHDGALAVSSFDASAPARRVQPL